MNFGQFQELIRRVALSASAQRYTQVTVYNSAGRAVVKSITPMAAEGQRRATGAGVVASTRHRRTIATRQSVARHVRPCACASSAAGSRSPA